MTSKWSSQWNSSTNPTKQRNYRENAPQHIKDKLVSANLAPELREELGTRSLNLNVGDRVEVMRGDEKGKRGIISEIDRDEQKVYVDGIEVEKNDGTMREKALRPSNLQIHALNLEDSDRIEKYGVEETADIEVEKEEVEEVLEEDEENEMMKQMQKQQDVDMDEIDEEELEEEVEEMEETEEEVKEESGEDEEEQDLEEVEEEVEEDVEEVEEEVEEAMEELEEIEEELESGNSGENEQEEEEK
ncbi:MAG: 50S ribosomal protein L24 [Candidatus Nanohaloarchaea archaeon]